MAKVVDPLEEKLLRAEEEVALHKRKQKEAEDRKVKINAAIKARNQKECALWLKKVSSQMDKQLKELGGDRYYLVLPVETFSDELISAVWNKVTAVLDSEEDVQFQAAEEDGDACTGVIAEENEEAVYED